MEKLESLWHPTPVLLPGVYGFFFNLRFLFDADHFKSIIEIILILLLFYIFVFVAGRHVGS